MTTKCIRFELKFGIYLDDVLQYSHGFDVEIPEDEPLVLPESIRVDSRNGFALEIYSRARTQILSNPESFEPLVRHGRVEGRDLIGRQVTGVDTLTDRNWKLYVSGVKIFTDSGAAPRRWLTPNLTHTTNSPWGDYVSYVSDLVADSLDETLFSLESYQLLVKAIPLDETTCHYELYTTQNPGVYRKGSYSPVEDKTKEGFVALQLKAETVPGCEPLFLPLRNVFVGDPTQSLSGFKRIAVLEGDAAIARRAGVSV